MATSIAEPYRDPRTAYGRRIPVGEATELAGLPPDAPPRSSAAPPAGEPPQQRRGTVSRAGLRSLAGPAGLAAAAAPEALDVARVARNPNATGIDVATQASEGIGRLASAGAGAAGGAKLGAMAAPFLGPLAPAAPIVGGIAGGAFGYFAGDQAIRGAREMAGVDPRSPVDQIQQPAAPARREAGAGRGFVNPQSVADMPAPQAGPNTIIRDGNSYSGPAGITEGADIRRPNMALRNGGQVSTVPGRGEEVQAIENRVRAINDSMAQTQRGLDTYGPGPNGGGVAGIGGATLSSASREKFDSTPSLSTLPAQGQSRQQFENLRAAERENMRNRDTTERGQMAVLAGQQVAANTQRSIADLQTNAQRDVAAMAADSRMSAAESNANARAAAAEASARRFTVVPGGQETVEIGGMPTVVKRPDRVLENATGRFIDEPTGGGKPQVTSRAEYDKLPKGARYTGPDGKTYVKG